MRHYATYFDHNYLKQGLALHASMERHCHPYHLWILALCDETWDYLTRSKLPNVTVVNMEGFETAALKAARANRTWREYIWTLTGSWMLYALNMHDLDHISYIDADCYFFSSPEPIYEEIGAAPLGITPHRFAPKYRKFEVNGLYNVGLVYATREGIPCLNHWAEQCVEWCYYRNEDGRFADQKYLDKWPENWGAHVISHKGANLAPWNQAQYKYVVYKDHLYVNEQKLIWYHFHQGLEPKWQIHEFVNVLVYPPYEVAFRLAEKEL